jgi:hypothetical protein
MKRLHGFWQKLIIFWRRALALDPGAGMGDFQVFCLAGGVLVSTWELRQRRHAEDDALASLIIASKKTANEELALAA